MKMIHELVGQVALDGDVGIELEVEGEALPNLGAGVGWKAVIDNSLRNGMEYVTKGPVPIGKLGNALDAMDSAFKRAKSQLKYSFRTSTHVHVNVQRMTPEEVMAFVYAYTILENVLVDYCAPERSGNRFCLRLMDAEGQIQHIKRLIEYLETPEYFARAFPAEGSIKYSAINLFPIRKYGSVEFRTLEGTNNWERIRIWASALTTMRDQAKKLGTIQKVWDTLNKLGEEGFLKYMLQEYAPHFQKKGYQEVILMGASLSYDLILTYQSLPVKKKRKLIEEEEGW